MIVRGSQKPKKIQRSDRRVAALTDQLTALARELGESARLPTTRELCQRFNVSSVTLRSALESLEARQVVRRHPRSGVFVSEKLNRKRLVVLVGPAVFLNPGRSPFWGELLTRCVEESDHRSSTRPLDFAFHLINQEEALPTDHPILQQARTGEIDGIIALGVNLPGGERGIYDLIPIVHFASGGPWVVGIDYGAIYALGTQALAQHGCQRIGLWKPVGSRRLPLAERDDAFWHYHFAQRDAFLNALEANGLPFYPSLLEDNLDLLEAPESVPLSLQEQGYRAAMRVFGPESLLPPGERPDGVLVTDDIMTTGALAALRELDLRVGTDVKIATHSNTNSILLFGYENALSLIEVDPAEIVHALFDTLEDLLAGRAVELGMRTVAPRLKP